jgi:predicted transcriptional regulator
MLALSIRQPFAELILRGIKKVEYRSRRTSVVGERFWIYASKKLAVGSGPLADFGELSRAEKNKIWSDDLAAAGVPGWLAELAEQVGMIGPRELGTLPTGVVVGSAVIESVSQIDSETFGWKLADVRRARKLRKPSGHPQPVWFRPFKIAS